MNPVTVFYIWYALMIIVGAIVIVTLWRRRRAVSLEEVGGAVAKLTRAANVELRGRDLCPTVDVDPDNPHHFVSKASGEWADTETWDPPGGPGEPFFNGATNPGVETEEWPTIDDEQLPPLPNHVMAWYNKRMAESIKDDGKLTIMAGPHRPRVFPIFTDDYRPPIIMTSTPTYDPPDFQGHRFDTMTRDDFKPTKWAADPKGKLWPEVSDDDVKTIIEKETAQALQQFHHSRIKSITPHDDGDGIIRFDVDLEEPAPPIPTTHPAAVLGRALAEGLEQEDDGDG